MTKKISLILLSILFFSSNVFAYTAKNKNIKKGVSVQESTNKADSADNSQKIIEEYKSYVASVDKAIREEVIAYRKEVAEINKKKRDIYKVLSEEAQSFLIKEQEYRKKLPIGQKKLINLKEASESGSVEDNAN